jgi:hypothetical protein
LGIGGLKKADGSTPNTLLPSTMIAFVPAEALTVVELDFFVSVYYEFLACIIA